MDGGRMRRKRDILLTIAMVSMLVTFMLAVISLCLIDLDNPPLWIRIVFIFSVSSTFVPMIIRATRD